jgi:hypothetical protein
VVPITNHPDCALQNMLILNVKTHVHGTALTRETKQHPWIVVSQVLACK